MGISVGVHVLAFTTLTIEIPTFGGSGSNRALEVVELRDLWADRALQVVTLETAPKSRAPSGAATQSAATSARVEASQSGAGGDATPVTVIIPKASVPGGAPNEPSMHVTLASATVTSTPRIATRPSNRGIIRRSESRDVVRTATRGSAGAQGGFEFVAASDAAREAERERGGNGWGGLGGIGTTILGGGGECPPDHGPGIGPLGGFGGVPTTGKGLGIIGRRPPGGAAINRLGPSRGW